MIRGKNFWKISSIICLLGGLLLVASPAYAAKPSPTPSSSNAANRHEINQQRSNLVRTFVQAIHAANAQFKTDTQAAREKLHNDLAAAKTKAERLAAINTFHQAIRKAVATMQAAKAAARAAFLAGLKAL